MPPKKGDKKKPDEPDPEAERKEQEAEAAADLVRTAAAEAQSRPQPLVEELKLTEAEAARALALIGGLPAVMHGCVPCGEMAGVARAFGTDLTPELEEELIGRSDLVRAASASPGALLTVREAVAVLASTFASPRFYGAELRLAAGRGQLAVVNSLIRRGCDPCAADGAGTTAAHAAVDRGQRAALGAMRDAWGPERFDFDIPDKDGWTPLHLAAAGGFAGMASDLLAWGADPGARNGVGRTPLHAAAAGDHPALVPVLVSGGADVEAADAAGWTAMHVAALHGAARCVDALAAAGASTAAQDLGERLPSKVCHPDASLSLRKAGRAAGERPA